MELIFVRHGEPDYAHDCLTPKGRRQAEIVAKRLSEYDIREIYASPLGRAQETALPFSQATGLPVNTLPYMHELEWSSRSGKEIFANGHPWFCAEEMAKNGWDLTNPGWRDTPYFNDNTATDNIDMVGENIDHWLASFGMIREGVYYRNTRRDSEPFAVVRRCRHRAHPEPALAVCRLRHALRPYGDLHHPL